MFSNFYDILNKVYIDRFPKSSSLKEEKDEGETALHTQTESRDRECIRNGSGLLHKQGIITLGGM